MITFDEINDATGFANGALFTDAAAVREYFTAKTMRYIFGRDAEQDQDTLDAYAAAVIAHGWHMIPTAHATVSGA